MPHANHITMCYLCKRTEHLYLNANIMLCSRCGQYIRYSWIL